MPTNGAILVLNSGSSSLKFGLFTMAEDGTEVLAFEGNAERIGRPDGQLHVKASDGRILLAEDQIFESQSDALRKINRALQNAGAATPAGIGHRVVHGGPHLREHTRITPEVLALLKKAEPFAPLHIPGALALIEQTTKLYPDLPQLACFDTAFHRTMPDVAAVLPIPARYKDGGIIRYGFHGLSYESIVARLGSDLPSRAVFAHLGSGSSLVAVRDAKSVDTTMGLTPTGGVPMGTRTGDLDPGVLLYLLRQEKLSAEVLERLVDHESGLAGYSGGESDMQALLARETSGDPAAALAVEAFCTAVRKTVGAYAALLGGLDLLVFTGGIGEHSAPVRRKICAGLQFLGLHEEQQQRGKVRVLPTGEDAQIAGHCRRLLG